MALRGAAAAAPPSAGKIRPPNCLCGSVSDDYQSGGSAAFCTGHFSTERFRLTALPGSWQRHHESGCAVLCHAVPCHSRHLLASCHISCLTGTPAANALQHVPDRCPGGRARESGPPPLPPGSAAAAAPPPDPAPAAEGAAGVDGCVRADGQEGAVGPRGGSW